MLTPDMYPEAIEIFKRAFHEICYLDNAEKNVSAAFELAMVRLSSVHMLYHLPKGAIGVDLLSAAYKKLRCEGGLNIIASALDRIFNNGSADSMRPKNIARRILANRVICSLNNEVDFNDGITKAHCLFSTLPSGWDTSLDSYPRPAYDKAEDCFSTIYAAASYTYDPDRHAIMLGCHCCKTPFLCRPLPPDKQSFTPEDEMELGRIPFTSAFIYKYLPLNSIAWLYRNFYWWDAPSFFEMQTNAGIVSTYRKCFEDNTIPTLHRCDEQIYKVLSAGSVLDYLYINDGGRVVYDCPGNKGDYFTIHPLYAVDCITNDNVIAWAAV